MIRIAITPEATGDRREAREITAVLDAGWDRVHLRHPGASLVDVRRIIDDVPVEYHRRLVLHGHFDLLYDYNLGGVHLNSRCPVAPSHFRGMVSRSCHTLSEIAMQSGMNYVTLCPVFDSISKAGYRSPFSPEDLSRVGSLGSTPVIALGGVTPERLPEIVKYGFSGYAVLGSLPWGKGRNEIVSILEKYK